MTRWPLGACCRNSSRCRLGKRFRLPMFFGYSSAVAAISSASSRKLGLPSSLGRIQQLEEPGRPDIRQSNRGKGTGLRVAIPVLNIHKTRLNDPFTWFLGTNDNPGDFRTSGCGSCHVVYANDRDPRHSGPYAQYGHWGTSQQVDPTIPKDEPGHPLKHSFHTGDPNQPVHDLPHASAQYVHQYLCRLHDVGL